MISLMMAKHRLKNLETTLKTCDRRYNNNWHIHAILGFEDN
jgi:hypothetical protein